MTALNYLGHGIVVEDGGDYGALVHLGPGDGSRFATDEQAVEWAVETFPPGSWHYAALTDGTEVPSLALTPTQKRLLALRMHHALGRARDGVVVTDVDSALVQMLDEIPDAPEVQP